MTRATRLLSLLTVLAALLAVAGCGSKQAATGDADPAKWAPADSIVYSDATIRPGEPLRSATDAVIRKVSLTPDWRAKLLSALERKSGGRINYAKDIDPWLGSRLGLFVSGPLVGRRPAVALVVDVRDEDKLKNELDSKLRGGSASHKTTYHGTDYETSSRGTATAVVKGALVVGSEAGMRKVIDVSQGSAALSDDGDFTAARGRVTSQRLALLYVNPGRAVDLIAQGDSQRGPMLEQAKRFFGLLGAGPTAAAVTPTPADLIVESAAVAGKGTATTAPGEIGRLFAGLPGDSWFATGAANVGSRIHGLLTSIAGAGGAGISYEQIKSLLQLRTGLDIDRDLLSWVGDAAIFVHGTTKGSLGGAIVFSSTNPTASQAAVSRIGQAVGRLAHRPVKTISVAGAKGVSLSDPRAHQPVLLVARGDRVVVAYGPASVRAALAPGSQLGDAPQLRAAARALGPGLQPGLYVSVPPIVDLARNSGAGSSPKFGRALPYLNAYRFIVSGGRRDGDLRRSRLVIGLR